jgi:hypothetical protein
MTMSRNCGGCQHFVAAALALEREVFGLNIVSSALGSVRADTGLCRRKDFFCVSGHHCGEWKALNLPHSASSVLQS